MSKQIKDLEMVSNTLEEKIQKLRIEESNLKGSIHAETMRFEAQKKLEDINLVNKDNVRKMAQDAKEAKILEREKVLERMEVIAKDRETMIEKAEQKYVDIDKRFHQLNKERKDFEAMRREQMAELDKIKEETMVLLSKEKMLIGKEDALRGREKAVIKKELFIQDEVGRLTEWEKSIKIQIEHLEGLKKELSYV